MSIEFMLVHFPDSVPVKADGVGVGFTNHTLMLPADEYTITIDAPDCVPASQDVVLAATSSIKPCVVVFTTAVQTVAAKAAAAAPTVATKPAAKAAAAEMATPATTPATTPVKTPAMAPIVIAKAAPAPTPAPPASAPATRRGKNRNA